MVPDEFQRHKKNPNKSINSIIFHWVWPNFAYIRPFSFFFMTYLKRNKKKMRIYRKQPLYLTRGRGKVCIHPTLPRPHLWDHIGYYRCCCFDKHWTILNETNVRWVYQQRNYAHHTPFVEMLRKKLIIIIRPLYSKAYYKNKHF